MKVVLLNSHYGYNKWPANIIIDVNTNDSILLISSRLKIKILFYSIRQSSIQTISNRAFWSEIFNKKLLLLFSVINPQLPFRNFLIKDDKRKKSWNNISNIPLNKPFYLSQLICGRISTSYENWLETNNQCSEISGKIASSMIRVAATRIFADPMQSMLELPVNSIDSYRSLRPVNSQHTASVGKFGMGFFSMLYWILKYPENILIIKSVTRSGRNWILKIFNDNNNLMGEFIDENSSKEYLQQENEKIRELINIDPNIQYGTTILLKNVSEKEIFNNDYPKNSVRDQLKKLEYINDVGIYNYDELTGYLTTINDSDKEAYIDEHSEVRLFYNDDEDSEGSENDESIYFQVSCLNPHDNILITPVHSKYVLSGFKFRDWAAGISIETLFRSLLIPSVSTKTIEKSYNRGNGDGYYLHTMGYEKLGLHISVGSIIVVEIYPDPRKYGQIRHLNLPIWVKIPVSRDDIIVEDNSPEYELLLKGFTDMIDITIESGYELQDLMTLLEKYASYSNQPTVFKIITQLYDYLNTLSNVIYLPNESIVKLLRFILKFSVRIAYLNKSSISEASNKLLIELQKSSKIIIDYSFNDVNIVVLPGYYGIPVNCGLPNFIFISPEFYNKHNWQENLIFAYSSKILLTLKKNNNNEINKWTTIHTGDIISSKNDKQLIWTLEGNYEERDRGMYSRLQTFDDLFFDSIFVIKELIENKLRCYGNFLDVFYVVGYHLLPVYILIKDFNLPLNIWQEYLYQLYNAISNLKIVRGEGVEATFVISYYPEIEIKQYDVDILTQTYSYTRLLPLLKPSTIQRIIQINSDWFYDQLGEDYLLQNFNYYFADERYNLFMVFNNINSELYLTNISTEHIDNILKIVCNYVIEQPLSSIQMYAILILIMKLIQSEPKENFDRMITDDFLTYMIKEVRSDYTEDFFVQWKKFHVPEDPEDKISYIDQYQVLFYNPMLQKLSLYLSQSLESIPYCQSLRPIETQYWFTANQLINYVFEAKVEKINNRSNLINLFRKVSSHIVNSDIEFQSVSIAVNEGTSKPFVSSVLTELLQNSIDAIRANISSVEQRIELDLCRSENLQFSITDYVGIPYSSMLALLIPFLSSKSVDDMMSTGEMGTGFFNVYRQPYSSRVIIETKNIIIWASPILKNGRVYDIDYKVEILNKYREGTKISILFNPLSFKQNIDLFIDIRINAINISRLSPFPTYFNSQLHELTKHIVYEDDVLTAYVTEETIQSYLLTNGVPFGPLMSIVNSVILGFAEANNYPLITNVLMDFKRGHYVPTQSRHRIQGIQKNLDSMIRGLWYALTYKLLQPEWSTTLPLYLDQVYAQSSIDTLKYYYGAATKFFARHTDDIQTIVTYSNINLIGIEHSLSYIIRYIVEKLSDQEINEENVHKYFIESVENIDGLNYDLIEQIIQLFFRNKKPELNIENINFSQKSNKQKRSINVSDISSIFNKFVEVYYSVGKTINIEGINFPDKVPKVKIAKIDLLRGLFLVQDNKIIINTKYLKSKVMSLRQSWNTLIRLYKQNKIVEMIQTIQMSFWRDYIGNVFPMSVLVHELQHSILKSDHNSTAAHEPILIGGKTRGFDDACQYVYERIMGEGFMQKFMESVLQNNPYTVASSY